MEDSGEVEHRFVHLEHTDKVGALVAELRDADRARTLVFVRTKRGADRLAPARQQGVEAVAMHGNKSQGQRQYPASFASGRVETLVATDVAARGIDVEEIAQVINYDAPGDRDAYVHRVGRSGRAGADGAGVSFVLPDQRAEMRKIASSLGLSAEFEHAGGAPSSTTGERAPRRPPTALGDGARYSVTNTDSCYPVLVGLARWRPRSSAPPRAPVSACGVPGPLISRPSAHKE